MGVDEGGSDDCPARARRLDPDYHAVVDRQLQTLVDRLGGVDDASLEHERVAAAVSAVEDHHATSSGTAARTGPVVSRS